MLQVDRRDRISKCDHVVIVVIWKTELNLLVMVVLSLPHDCMRAPDARTLAARNRMPTTVVLKLGGALKAFEKY